MKRLTRTFIMGIILVVTLYACNTPTPTPTPNGGSEEDIIESNANPLSGDIPSLSLNIQATNGSSVFNTVGQVINYVYAVTNTGNPALAGPVTITDDKAPAPACPGVNTVGNGDNNLDRGETVNCVSAYPITQNDLNACLVTRNATAQAGGISSSRVTSTVPMSCNKVLTLTVTPNTTTYSTVGQTITYSYTIKNTGSSPIGPDQFKITDNKIASPINCDVSNRTLGPSESISCSAQYVVNQTDLSATNLSSTTSASGGGITSAPVTTVITKGNPSSGNLTKGSNIVHNVVSGEWLYQIARCYGADIDAVLAANRQIPNPHWILPAMTVNVPNIGVKGTIYGPPCVGFYVVQVGDTWENIKTRFNADVLVLQAANRNVSLSNGVCIKIPLNSAGGAAATQQALSACPPGSTPAPNPNPNPTPTIRITIPAGQTITTVTGTVNPSEKVRYVFTANQGQLVGIRVLNAPANEVTLGVVASNNSTLKAQDTTLTFNGTLPAGGDSFIDIGGTSGGSVKQFLLELTITTPGSTTSFERVTDISTGTGSSDPAYLANFNNQLFFRATGSNNTGAELWKFDPATKTPSPADDIFVGASGSDPAYLTPFGGALYFKANGNDGSGSELWRWNGSDSGRLSEINPQGDANPSYLAVFNNTLYFSAKGPEGIELWKTDGNSVLLAHDINAGAVDSNPSYLAAFNNALYFSANSNDGFGAELYRFDGINKPTRVTDINPNAGNSNPSHLALFNNALYFAANDGSGVELWKYDGTNNPSRVADINPSGDSAPAYLTVFNGALYFSAISNDGAGVELWKYDGVNAPKRVGDLNTAGNSNPSYLIVFNNELYFQANGNDNFGTELWKFKGP